MNKLNHRPDGSNGFTLLEVIVSITIFAVCVSAVYLVYGSVTSVAENVEARMSLDRKARDTVKRMTADLKGMYGGERGMLTAVDSTSTPADDPILILTTTSHVVLAPDERPVDVSVIRYYLRENEDSSTFTLLRSDSPVIGLSVDDDLAEERYILATDVSELRITYIDSDGDERDEWESTPDDGEENPSFPVSFKVEMSLGSNEADNVPVVYAFSVDVSRYLFEFDEQS